MKMNSSLILLFRNYFDMYGIFKGQISGWKIGMNGLTHLHLECTHGLTTLDLIHQTRAIYEHI